eukprot:comp24410_c0_seq1/m.46679 comp24410_c0_seq1/g.46679  ORF comp24410_c0_seq1/g.46679 comp24410_c0_seq1/m.46679 type:complete len:391 (+) comp24410_c0_seq1:497-1669(+)
MTKKIRREGGLIFYQSADKHHVEEVAGSLGVHVPEHELLLNVLRLLARHRPQQPLAAGVLAGKLSAVIDEPVQAHPHLAAVLCRAILILLESDLVCLLVLIRPRDRLVEIRQVLLAHLVTCLVDLVLGGVLKVVAHTEDVPELDNALGRVVVVPAHTVLVREGKRVVETVVTLTESHQGGEEVVLGRRLVGILVAAEPVCERVHAPRAVPREDACHEAAIKDSLHSVLEYKDGESEGKEHGAEKVVFVLEHSQLLALKVAHINTLDILRPVDLLEHPDAVGEPETLVRAVRVHVSVWERVVKAVEARPPKDRALKGTGTGSGPEHPPRKDGFVGTVAPESVVADSDAKTGPGIHDEHVCQSALCHRSEVQSTKGNCVEDQNVGQWHKVDT